MGQRSLPYPRIYNLIDSIPYLTEPPSYQKFFKDHLFPNIPLLIGPELTKNWRARKEWIRKNLEINAERSSLDLTPNFKYLREHFGEAQVCVADCSRRYFTDQERTRMFFKEFIDFWEQSSFLSKDSKERRFLYCKDWHFVQAFPNYDAYEIPEIFRDDWMNEYWTAHTSDDYRFVYMGGNGTFTPFHVDVYQSYSWSANICGTKKWTLFPPNQEHLYKDSLGNMVYDLNDVDTTQFPEFSKAKRIVVYQHSGETLFVPSGWYHAVENIGDCISINHNWGQATAFDLMYCAMKSDLCEVQYAIRDVEVQVSEQEFVETCQQLLLANAGWDWLLFWRLVSCVTCRLLNQFDDGPVSAEQKSAGLCCLQQHVQRWKPPFISLQPSAEFIFSLLHNVIHDFLGQSHAQWYLQKHAISEQQISEIVTRIETVYAKFK